ncbi:MAG: A/G-specific adenine glycosylase [Corynebacterium sp.]|nr:A/G-specific adenine glycosylase [Corynebacterium sp.]
MQAEFQESLLSWFDANARPLPWREPGTSAWAILVSEIMSQQTPVARVAPAWAAWMTQWPLPSDLAAAPTSDVLRMWGKLGYPRRALRLKEAATAIANEHNNEVPADVPTLLALPGIGDYTARAVAAFAYDIAVPVVDVNVRRVLYRAIHGVLITPNAKKRDLDEVAELMPQPLDKKNPKGARMAAALMELGALVCVANNPRCEQCPIKHLCHWQKLGCPQPTDEELAAKKKRVQKYAGTDRQVRGIILDALKENSQNREYLNGLWEDQSQLSRALFSLLEDGLAVENHGLYALPD